MQLTMQILAGVAYKYLTRQSDCKPHGCLSTLPLGSEGLDGCAMSGMGRSCHVRLLSGLSQLKGGECEVRHAVHAATLRVCGTPNTLGEIHPT